MKGWLFFMFALSVVSALAMSNGKAQREAALETETKIKTLSIELRACKEELKKQNEANILSKPQSLKVTAYTACKKECDSTPGITGLNRKSKPGQTAAAGSDCRFLLGHSVYIHGLGVWRVTDIKPGKGIDLMVGTKKQARNIGVSYKIVNVIGGKK